LVWFGEIQKAIAVFSDLYSDENMVDWAYNNSYHINYAADRLKLQLAVY